MPNWKHIVRDHLAVLCLPPEREIEIVEELAQHLEDVYEAALGEGITEPEAQARALRVIADGRLLECELSRVERPLTTRWLPPEYLGRRGGMRMENLWQDLRYGARMLVKQPGFTFVAVLTLALGIGANTAIFSVVNAALLSPPPYAEPDRIVRVFTANPVRGWNNSGASLHDVIDWRQQNSVFTTLAAWNEGSVNLAGDGEPERVGYARVSSEFFSALGAEPRLGRAFLPEDDQPGRGKVVVLSHRFWQRYFGGDAQAIGKMVRLDGESYTVIGVMPAQVRFPEADVELWRPIALSPESTGERDGRWLDAFARLKPGVTLAQAEAEMKLIADRLSQQYPATNKDWTVSLTPLQESQVKSFRLALLLMWSAVGLVLLIACANVANLLLARAAAREKELAIRSAMGAGRMRIVRQLLTESLLLSLAGGAAGLLLAFWGRDLLPRLSGVAEKVALDYRVLGYSLALALLTGVLFGFLPAIKAAGANLNDALRESSRAMVSSRHRVRNLLVIGEVALTLMLLIGAGLLIRSFAALMKVNTGVEARNLLTMRVAPPQASPRSGESDEAFSNRFHSERGRMAVFYRTLIERIESLPGVEQAGAINRPPLAGAWWGIDMFAEGSTARAEGKKANALGRVVTPGYFRAMRIPLLRGRLLDRDDNENGPAVAVINQEVARRYWPNDDPIGKRLTLREGLKPMTIAGVVGDVHYTGMETEPDPTLYVAFSQAIFGHFGDWGMTLAVRAESDPLRMAAAIRAQVQALDPALPVYQVRSMAEVIDEATAARRSNMALLAVFAGLALAMAVVGLYGVVSWSVSQRTHEIGLRMALGAERRDILALIVGQGIRLTLAGVAIGSAAALAVTRLMVSLLYGVSATDPLTFVSIAALLIGVALLACYIPARRATRVDPMVALRHD